MKWTLGYVHANPTDLHYEFSTHRAYLDEDQRPGWLNTHTALRYYGGVSAYSEFMANRQLRENLNRLFF